MLIVHVHVHVKPEAVEAFKAAALNNARQASCFGSVSKPLGIVVRAGSKDVSS